MMEIRVELIRWRWKPKDPYFLFFAPPYYKRAEQKMGVS